MKEFYLTNEGIHRVISEPGDGTRYDYFVYQDGPDEFCFMPRGSVFQFPQRLNYREVKDILAEVEEVRESFTDSSDLFALSKKQFCNIFTLAECIRTIKEIKGDKR